jgi:hypothetical protein
LIQVNLSVPVAIESRTMETPSLFDGLAEVGLRGGVDMRPTLIRVLTDLYVQKLKHTEDEERHYTELALRLLDAVDAATRATVATRLARHLRPPLRVAQYLVNDLPNVAAPLRGHAVFRQALPSALPSALPVALPAALPEPQQTVEPAPEIAPSIPPVPEKADTTGKSPIENAIAPVAESLVESDSESPLTGVPQTLNPAVASELNTLFFTATEEERRLILLNLHIAAPVSAGEVEIAREPMVSQKLEAAALGSYRDDLARQFALALRIPGEQAKRITRDNFGEPMVVAIKALGVPRDVFHRILMFANPAVGHSVERVQVLAALFDDLPLPAAEAMVAIWQALPKSERTTGRHQPVHWDDQGSHARPAAAQSRRPQATSHSTERRNKAS